jgi:hypothetical protein
MTFDRGQHVAVGSLLALLGASVGLGLLLSTRSVGWHVVGWFCFVVVTCGLVIVIRGWVVHSPPAPLFEGSLEEASRVPFDDLSFCTSIRAATIRPMRSPSGQ